jgi:hypothetical protein
MPTAICTFCQTTQRWTNQRGTRLSDLRCTCGGAFVRAEWREGKYQTPLPKPLKAKVPPAIETLTGEIWAKRVDGEQIELIQAHAGDTVTLYRNGYYGSFEGRIICFRGRKVKLQLLRRDGVALPAARPIWIRRGFSKLTPSLNRVLTDPAAFLETHGKPTTVFADLEAANQARLAGAPLIDLDEVQKGRDWSELGTKVFGREGA